MTARPRLVIALAVASLLAVFLVYQSLAGASTLLVSVDQLIANKNGALEKTVQLTGTAVSCEGGPCEGQKAPFTFTLKDHASERTVPVHYPGGSVPDPFKDGREVIVTGRLSNGTFQAEADSLVTKCPSKYSGGQDGSGG